MKIVGKIDACKFKGILPYISVDEVVLTDERERHINERRGEKFLIEYLTFFPGIIRDPDVIFEDEGRENTVLFVKRLDTDKKSIAIVIRIVVSGEPSMMKNSVITAIPLGDKRYREYLRNKKKLYTRE